MPDYERSETIAASPEEVYDYVSAPRNLASYVSTMRSADPLPGNRLRVAAEVAGRQEEGEAEFAVDPAARRIDWHGSSRSGYRGWLSVAPSGAEAAVVTIHLSTQTGEERKEIESAIIDTLGNIRAQVGAGAA